MEILYIIPVLLVIAAIYFFAVKPKQDKKKGERVSSDSPDNIPVSLDVRTTTPRGIKLISGKSVSDAEQKTMDNALTELFSDARAESYAEKLNHTDYAIFIKEDCVDRGGTPSWLVNAPNYDGTEYDQNPAPGIGEVYCAEQVIFAPRKSDWLNVPTMEYIICRGDLELMANTTRYGAEHIILWHNDPLKYRMTETHIGSGHPIIPIRTTLNTASPTSEEAALSAVETDNGEMKR